MSWHLAPVTVATKHTNTTSDLECAGKHSLCKNTNRITTNKQMLVIFLTVRTFHQLLFHMENHGHPYHTSTQTLTHTHTYLGDKLIMSEVWGVNLCSSRDHGVSGEGLCKMAMAIRHFCHFCHFDIQGVLFTAAFCFDYAI